MNILIDYTVTVVDEDGAYQVGATCGGSIENGEDGTQQIAEMFRESLEEQLNDIILFTL